MQPSLRRRVGARWRIAWMTVTIGEATAATAPSRAAPNDRVPIAEPVLNESLTDIDAVEAGELEIDANAFAWSAWRGGAGLRQMTLEVEYRVLERVGLRAEPSFAETRPPGGSSTFRAGGLQAGASYSLLHDLARDLHVQCELNARIVNDRDDAAVAHPGDAELPFAFDVRAAWRRERWTVRPSLGAGFGEAPAHSPLRAGLAVLMGVDSAQRFGFVGLEVDGDFARQTPFVVAVNVVSDGHAMGWPVRVGVALPFLLGAASTQPSMGVYFRFMVEPFRDAD